MPTSWLACIVGLKDRLVGPSIDEKWLKPSSTYRNLEAIDLRKLRRLVINGSLVPCFTGGQDAVGSPDQAAIDALCYKLLKMKKLDVTKLKHPSEWEE